MMMMMMMMMMISSVAVAQSSGTMSSPMSSLPVATVEKEGAARKKCEFTSMAKIPASANWPLAYVTFRHKVADKLGNLCHVHHHYRTLFCFV